MRIVIGTNDFISALIGKKHREKLKSVVANPDVMLFADENLLIELSKVAGREKFRNYVSLDEAVLFVEIIRTRLRVISPTTIVTDSPDPDDNYLLALSVDAQADYLIMGDKKHPLALNPYRGIQIIRIQALLDILAVAYPPLITNANVSVVPVSSESLPAQASYWDADKHREQRALSRSFKYHRAVAQSHFSAGHGQLSVATNHGAGRGFAVSTAVAVRQKEFFEESAFGDVAVSLTNKKLANGSVIKPKQALSRPQFR